MWSWVTHAGRIQAPVVVPQMTGGAGCSLTSVRRWAWARGVAADRRLRHRWLALEARKKPAIAVAVARELAGWCWSLATMRD